MKPYKSISGKPAGVIAYETTGDSITVMFTNGTVYFYSYATAGAIAIEDMKLCAKTNLGLSTYIAQHHPSFEKRS